MLEPNLKAKDGFTIIELMIVTLIISILAAIAFPSYQNYARESRRAEGTGELLKIMSLQERFYANGFPPMYTTDLTQLGYANNPVITENFYYSITATDNCGGLATCISLTATALAPQANDGNLTLDSFGNKSRLGAGVTDANATGWD